MPKGRGQQKLEGLTERLNQAFNDNDISMKELVYKAGISTAGVHKVLREGIQPCPLTLARFCLALDVSSDWVLGLTKTSETNQQSYERGFKEGYTKAISNMLTCTTDMLQDYLK